VTGWIEKDLCTSISLFRVNKDILFAFDRSAHIPAYLNAAWISDDKQQIVLPSTSTHGNNFF
jgi:hypothetical protein